MPGGADAHQREEGRIAWRWGRRPPLVRCQMAAQQGIGGLAHRAQAELLAEPGVDGLALATTMMPEVPEVEAMDQGAAGVIPYQAVMDRIEFCGFLPERLSRPLGLLMSSRCSSSNRILCRPRRAGQRRYRR